MTRNQLLALDKSLSRTNLKGKVWTFTQFRKQFGKIFPQLNAINPYIYEGTGRIRTVSVYSDINKVLRKRGLAIKSVNYGRKFMIIEDASEKVTYLRSAVSRITASANELNLGLFTHGGTYSRLTTSEIDSLVGEAAYFPGNRPY